MKKQRGGTILGVIIGVVAGLGVALLVAVYVTKVPVPFFNKGQTRSADQDAAEAQKNKDWDPNSALYGKNPVRPASPVLPEDAPTATDGSATPEPTSAPVLEPAPPATVEPPAPRVTRDTGVASVQAPSPALRGEPKPALSADPLGDLAKARTDGASSDPFIYFVQVGAYRSLDDAESQRARLSLSGVQAKVTGAGDSERSVYRVRVGPFAQKEDAEKARERLNATGMATALVRVQR